MENIVRHLSESLFFQRLGSEELAALAQCGTRFVAPAGVEIIRRGEEGDALFLVLEGAVKVTIPEEPGQEFFIARLSKGSVFGELSLLDCEPRSATVTTEVETTLFMIRRPDFHRLLLCHQGLLAWLLAGLSRRVRESTLVRHQEEVSHRLAGARREVERQRAITNMVAGIADELNAPLGACLTAASMISQWLSACDAAAAGEAKPDWQSEVINAATLLIDNLTRCCSLVQSFSEIPALLRRGGDAVSGGEGLFADPGFDAAGDTVGQKGALGGAQMVNNID